MADVALESWRRARTEITADVESFRRAPTQSVLESFRRARSEMVVTVESFRRARTNTWPIKFYNAFVNPT